MQLPIDICGFKMAKLSALKICLKANISNFPPNFFNMKISAIIRDIHLKFSVLILFVSREGSVFQILYLVPSNNVLKFC